MLKKKAVDRSAVCSVEGCSCQIGKYGSRGMCHKHYQQFNREAKREASNTICGCGCGGKTVPGYDFLLGHHTKTEQGKESLRIARYRGAVTKRGSYLSITPEAGIKKYQHVAIAEAVLGKPLPDGAEVHHVDSNRLNNANSNLVICPNRAYHLLLHKRTRALEACGNANWLKCWICGSYDEPRNLYQWGGRGRHAECHSKYMNERYRK